MDGSSIIYQCLEGADYPSGNFPKNLTRNILGKKFVPFVKTSIFEETHHMYILHLYIYMYMYTSILVDLF